jgi:DNA-binding MarR family transcriptional regulator
MQIYREHMIMPKPNAELIQRWWAELERSSRVLGRVGPDEICCEGLTQRQCAILRLLAGSEGSRLSDLAATAGITPSAMTRLIERLEARGLVARVHGSEPDARVSTLKITPAGRRIRSLLDDLMRKRTAQILHAVPAESRQMVLLALKTLNLAIEASDFCGLNAPVQRLSDTGPSRRKRR